MAPRLKVTRLFLGRESVPRPLALNEAGILLFDDPRPRGRETCCIGIGCKLPAKLTGGICIVEGNIGVYAPYIF